MNKSVPSGSDLAVAGLGCASKYSSRGLLNKPGLDIVFTNYKLPSIHSESVATRRSKAVHVCREKGYQKGTPKCRQVKIESISI